MKLKIFLTGAFLILAMTVTAAGADVAGKWVAEQQGGQGTQQTTFNFTVNGGTLTGTVSGGRGGDAEISEGKIEGDEISFVVVRTMGETEMRTLHKGKISGDEIRFTIERQGGGRGGPGGEAAKPGGQRGQGGPGGGTAKPGGGGQGGGAAKPGGGAAKPGGGQRGQGGPQEIIAKRVQ